MITIKELIGIMIGNEAEPEVTVSTGMRSNLISGKVVNYGEDALLLRVKVVDGETHAIFPYANLNYISKRPPYSKED